MKQQLQTVIAVLVAMIMLCACSSLEEPKEQGKTSEQTRAGIAEVPRTYSVAEAKSCLFGEMDGYYSSALWPVETQLYKTTTSMFGVCHRAGIQNDF